MNVREKVVVIMDCLLCRLSGKLPYRDHNIKQLPCFSSRPESVFVKGDMPVFSWFSGAAAELTDFLIWQKNTHHESKRLQIFEV
jgi:hypothetical protein